MLESSQTSAVITTKVKPDDVNPETFAVPKSWECIPGIGKIPAPNGDGDAAKVLDSAAKVHDNAAKVPDNAPKEHDDYAIGDVDASKNSAVTPKCDEKPLDKPEKDEMIKTKRRSSWKLEAEKEALRHKRLQKLRQRLRPTVVAAKNRKSETLRSGKQKK